MKNKDVFFNPFRLISPKLDAEASRLDQLHGPPPAEVTCLEEGLLIMTGKLIEMTGLLRKSLIIAEPARLDLCERLAREIHVCHPHPAQDFPAASGAGDSEGREDEQQRCEREHEVPATARARPRPAGRRSPGRLGLRRCGRSAVLVVSMLWLSLAATHRCAALV